MQTNQFGIEDQAKQMANDEIFRILSDKQYLNPDKFDKQHSNFKHKIEQLESQIAFTIKNQIESINSTRNFIDDCYKNVEKCEVEVEQLNDIYVQDAKFHKDCESFEKLSIFKKNVGVMLDQLKYFFNVKQQIEKMEQFFHQGPDHYEQISFKLMTLTDIRDNVVENIKSDSKATSKEMQIIIQEFQSLSEFEEKFYSTIFSQFELTLLVSLKNPHLLITLLRIVEAGDKILLSKGKALESIIRGIDKKFEDRLKDQKEAILVLEHSKFTANDLILVLDHTVKCFPKHYEIFNVYERSYKLNIEKRIMPFLDDEEEVKKSFGTLINLLNWVDSYDGLLLRVGMQDESYVLLKSKVKFYMPYFLEHIQSLIVDYGEKAILKDKEEQQTSSNIEKLIKSKQELVTYFPEDIFHFINSQLDHLGPKLKGELFIELLRVIYQNINLSICQSISEVQQAEARNFIENVPLTEESGQGLSPVFLVTLYINNFYKCMSHANETKQYCVQFVGQDSDLQERVEHVFTQDLSRSFNESITMFLEHMVKMVFYEVNTQLILELFQPRWINEDIITQIVSTIKDYLDDVQLLLVNQIYFNKLTKLVFSNLVNAYVEQLIMTVRYVQPTIAKNFFPKHLQDLTMMQEKKKKEKGKKTGITNILQNRELIIPQIEHDCDSLMKIIENDYAQAVGKLTKDNLVKKFTLIISLLQKPKMEIEGLNNQLLLTFDHNAVHLLDVGMWIREDCDAQFKQQRLDQILSLQNKSNIQA